MLAHSIAGAPLLWWIAFHLAVLALLIADASLPHSRSRDAHPKLAWLWSLFVALVAAGFAFWLNARQGRQTALEFVSGYAIETSLSIDNLFVFLLLFRGFGIGHRQQHKALMWGVGGAILLRALCITMGISLLNHLAWVSYLFAALLLYAALRLLRGGNPASAIPGWIVQLQRNSRSLLWVIVAVEFTDLLFAVDSIPAVLAVSHDPFVVYTSNIAAILGLRSLYFALASLLDRLRYLHYGLAALLVFVGIKMMIAHWIEIPILASLAVLGVIFLATALVSLLIPLRVKSPKEPG